MIKKYEDVQPRDIRSERMTGSGIVCNTPALIFQVITTGDGGGLFESELYDGSSDKADFKMDLYGLSGSINNITFNPPLLMNRGIYVKLIKKLKSVVIRYADYRE